MNYTKDTIKFEPLPTHGRFQNLTGVVYGRLTVIAFGGIRNATTFWFCECECGVIKKIAAGALKRITKPTKSCGCWTHDLLSQSHITHGHTLSNTKPTPEYSAYRSARARCNNPNNINFPHYGKRGIEFRFNSFEEFFTEVGFRPSNKHSLNRIDNNGHYEKGNLEWTTRNRQCRNRRSNVMLTIDGLTLTMAQWIELCACNKGRVENRRQLGWCDKCMIYNRHNEACHHKASTGTATISINT